MRVAIYIRVSTKLQEDRYSLPAQTRELTEYANSQNWTIVATLKDVGSGKKLDKDGLNELLVLAEEEKIDVVLVIDQDRLSRLEPIDWEFLKSILAENNVKIAEPGNIVDLSNDDHVLISDIRNSLARSERRKTMKRSMRGKKQRAREGKAWGGVTYGEYKYDKETGTYFIKDEWRWLIPFIDDLYLSDTLGMNAIAQELNKLSPAPSGKRWTEGTVFRRLTAKAYHGVEEIKFRDGETITSDGIYEPVRTIETYKKIQTLRERRRGQYKITSRQRRLIHPLRRTKLRCGSCGSGLRVTQSGDANTPHYYVKHGKQIRASDGHTCHVSINTLRFMDNVIDVIQDLLSGGEVARKYLNLAQDDKSVQQLKNNIKGQKRALNDAKLSIDRLLDLYLSGDLEKEKFKSKEKELNDKVVTLEKQLLGSTTKLDAIEKDNFTFDAINQYLEITQNLDTDLTPLELANLIGNIFPSGVVYEGKIVMETNLKGIPFEIDIPIDKKVRSYKSVKSYTNKNSYYTSYDDGGQPLDNDDTYKYVPVYNKVRSDSKTGITGVTSKTLKSGEIRYYAKFQNKHLGTFDTPEDASEAHKKAWTKHVNEVRRPFE